MRSIEKLRIRLSSVKLIPISFFLAIVLGTLLLMLPAASAPGEKTDFVTALFTATTSVCVTGLVVVDTYAHWSLFGQLVILLLVQAGALGIVTVASVILLAEKKKFSLSDRRLLSDSLNVERHTGLVSFLKRIIGGTLLVEGIGAILFAVRFVPLLGPGKGLWAAVFQSVSAFCNAGMDVVGPDSMIGFNDSPYLLCLTMLLIVLGGLGFVVWFDLIDTLRSGVKNRLPPGKMLSRLPEHSKLVLAITAVLILCGAAGVFATEYRNPATIGEMPLSGKLLNSLFQSVTFRTAGFASVPQEKLTESTCLIGCILMFIGGSPVGTAGGIKTVTAFLVLMNAISFASGKNENVIFRRHVSEELMRKAAAIAFVSALTAFVMTLLLLSRGGIALTDALYEIVSALGTVGLSRGLTPNLDVGGRLIVTVSMYLGRVGPISMVLFFARAAGAENRMRHAKGTFYVG